MADNANTRWRGLLSRPVDIDPFRPVSSAAQLEVAATSVCGLLRPDNTDHYLVIRLSRTQETVLSSLAEIDLPPRFEEHAYALLVADGLGDKGSGARASRVALSAIAHLAIRHGKWNVRVDADSVKGIVEQGDMLYRRTHDAVFAASREDLELADMATSLTAIYVAGADLFFAHVGHSRAFLFRGGGLVQLTTDHTIEQRQPKSANGAQREHARRDFVHAVTDTIGGDSDPRLDIEHVTLSAGDRLLLCTNGLTDALSSNDIASVLALRRRPADDCQRLLELAHTARAADDVTVIVADYRLSQ